MGDTDFAPKARPVLDYFDKVWMGRHGLKEPLFPHIMWNYHSAVVGNLPRTNNAVEGWHSGFNSLIRANPMLWDFISKIKMSCC